ncbi:MAG: hypothetical protein HYT09_00945 [Candidatus Levybacteria bacterium]|nr:hypothetical protein [Candidatus Levybacteria bacterium]
MSELEHRFKYEDADVSYTPDFDSLPDDLKQRLEPELADVAARGFRRMPTPEFRQDVANHIRGGDLYITQQNGEASGFAMLKKFPSEGVIYIAGVVKKPTAPSGIVEAVVKHHLDETELGIVTVRTQNDRVLEILTKTCDSVVALDRKSTPEEVDLLLKLGLVKADSDLDVDYLIHRGYYGFPMIADGIRRRSGDVRISDFTEKLRYFDGDAAYGIGYRG